MDIVEIVRKCDRCGKIEPVKNTIKLESPANDELVIEICYDCFIEFRIWLYSGS